MKSPHIIFISRRYPPSVGGLERLAYDVSHALEKRIKLQRVVWRGKSRLSAVLVQPWLFVMALWQLLRHNDISVIHSQDAVTAPPAWLLAKLFHKPWLTMVHGLDLTYKNAFYQIVVLWFVRRADKVVAISHNTRDEALKRGILPENIIIITPGINDQISTQSGTKADLLGSIGLSALADKQVVLTVGRLIKRKGVLWFVENVLPALYKQHPNLCYVIVGEGPDKRAIEAAIQVHKLGDIVHLVGRVDDRTKAVLYRVSDIFVMPNIPVDDDLEGFGIVALEAAMAGLPVVASRLEGICDALSDQENGWLMAPYDANDYHQAISTLLASAPRRQRFGARARTYTLAHYGWEGIADKFIQLYGGLRLIKKPSRNLKLIASIAILILTLATFLLYVRHNPKVITELLQVNPLELLKLIFLYALVVTSQLAVLYFSLVFYGKKISLGDNFLISSYSSLTNFFGPTQAGSGVRALYLKAKMNIRIKDFIFVTLIYYACYAAVSIVMLLAGAGRLWQSVVALVAVVLFSAAVVRWYKKSRQLHQQKLHLAACFGILAATLMQVAAQSIIYFIEVTRFAPHVTLPQAISYTGAANFSLFVSITPGAIGIREAFLLFSERLHHVSSSVIVSAGVLDRAVYIVFLGLLFVSVIALHGRRKLQAFRSGK
jgi:glycosyltransferase involved in cell wall biosynthesis/uncharacterized membrane protein YbhN (UPF0104 family)